MATQKFKSIYDFIQFLPKNERIVTDFLREISHECLPRCTEKLSYNVPYFYLNKPVCFIWPGAVFWGNKRMYDGVRFGFCQGHLQNQQLEYFKLNDRKRVSYRDFKAIEEIDIDLLKLYLFESIEIDHRLSEK